MRRPCCARAIARGPESPETDKQVAQAEADYDLQRVTDRRNQTLAKLGVLRQTADESNARLLQRVSLLAQLKAMQAYEIIRAPFEGMVTVRNVDPGTLIPESTTAAAANQSWSLRRLSHCGSMRKYHRASPVHPQWR